MSEHGPLCLTGSPCLDCQQRSTEQEREAYFMQRRAVALHAAQNAISVLTELPIDMTCVSFEWIVGRPVFELRLALEALRPWSPK